VFNRADYFQLGYGRFINNNIINLYLWYVVSNLSETLQKQTHLFDTLFYDTLILNEKTPKPNQGT
jgi:Ulp1 family protease